MMGLHGDADRQSCNEFSGGRPRTYVENREKVVAQSECDALRRLIRGLHEGHRERLRMLGFHRPHKKIVAGSRGRAGGQRKTKSQEQQAAGQSFLHGVAPTDLMVRVHSGRGLDCLHGHERDHVCSNQPSK